MTFEEQFKAQYLADGFDAASIQFNTTSIAVFVHRNGKCSTGFGSTIAEAYRKACLEAANKTTLAWEKAA